MGADNTFGETNFNPQHSTNILLPAVPTANPKDADGNTLHEGDRVFGYDFGDAGYQRVYGTLTKSDEPKTFGHWCVDYDDGESFMVLSFESLYKA